jgi:YD repeat-containing protein
MDDPSAGIYTYSYDAFGQLKTENHTYNLLGF